MDRKELEASFHGQRERDRLSMSDDMFYKKYPNKRFYSIAHETKAYEQFLISTYAPGSVALDYCCGLGHTALALARAGAVVTGIDISEDEVDSARNLLQANKQLASFHVMDAEHTSFPDNTFDLIVCNGCLHHLDLGPALKELSRILKPSGKIIAIESLGYNPLIQLYRRLTPNLRTKWETDHIIKLGPFYSKNSPLEIERIRFFYISKVLVIPFLRFRSLTNFLSILLSGLDSVLQKIPLIQLLSWQVIFVLKQK